MAGDLDDALAVVRRADPGAHVVGGAVRDRLLGRASPYPADLDISLSVPIGAVSAALVEGAGATRVVLDAKRGHERIFFPAAEESRPGWIDLTSHGADLAGDLARRDFTANSLAVPLSLWSGPDISKAVVDPHRGVRDLKRKIIRETVPGNIAADPLRALRAARLVAQLGFAMEAATERAVRAAAGRLAGISPERIREEVYGVFNADNSMAGVLAMDRTGTLSAVFPELDAARGVVQPPNHHYWDVFNHSVRAVGKMDAIMSRSRRGEIPAPGLRIWPDDPDGRFGARHFGQEVGDRQDRRTLLRLATLLHDIGKPVSKTVDSTGRTRFLGHGDIGAEITGQILKRFRCSRKVVDHVSLIVREHLRPGQISGARRPPSRRALFRYHRDLGLAAADTVFLSVADYLAARGPLLDSSDWEAFCGVADVILNPVFETPGDSKASLLLNGNEIQRHFNLQPGPGVGRLLGLLRDAEATGRIQTQEEAIEMLRSEISRWGDSRGRHE